jgi:anaerobic ribonucleoside-triphosphate reductase
MKKAQAQNFCHDCGKEIKMAGDELKNGKILVYNDNGNKITIIKCDECYEKNPRLNNFRNCEVYSRIVGYLRPTEQWNKGKQQEYKDRLVFKV